MYGGQGNDRLVYKYHGRKKHGHRRDHGEIRQSLPLSLPNTETERWKYSMQRASSLLNGYRGTVIW